MHASNAKLTYGDNKSDWEVHRSFLCAHVHLISPCICAKLVPVKVRSHDAGMAKAVALATFSCRYNWISLYLMELFRLCENCNGCGNGTTSKWSYSCECSNGKLIVLIVICCTSVNSLAPLQQRRSCRCCTV